MRVILQRVSSASVTIDQQIHGSIDTGLVVLLGIQHSDTPEDGAWLAGKIAGLRIFPDENGKMNRDVRDIGGDILLISQFTLFGSTRKGNRPSFNDAAPPSVAIPLYETFIRQLTSTVGRPVQTGQFGADMKVALVNDGPVTLMIDSRLRE